MTRKHPGNRQITLEMLSPEPAVPFTSAEYENRIERVKTSMRASNIDILYAASPDSLLYLTGYEALWYQYQVLEHWVPISGVAIHVDADQPILFENDAEKNLCRYRTSVRDIRILERHDMKLIDFIVSELKSQGWAKGTLGLEMYAIRPPRAVSEQFQSKMEQAGVSKTVDATHIVNGVKHIKSPQELAFVRTASRIAEVGHEAARNAIQPGATELDVWAEVMGAMGHAGGENPGITIPVASGSKSSIPHSMPSRRVLCAGDIVNVDVCAVYNRYHADCSRSYSIGEPHPDVADAVSKAAGAFDVLGETAKPEMLVQEVAEALKRYYEEVGLTGEQWWTGGYDLGASMPPDWVGPWSWDIEVDNGEKRFEEGMVVNYESDFYLPRGAGLTLLIDTMLFEAGAMDFPVRTPRELCVVE